MQPLTSKSSQWLSAKLPTWPRLTPTANGRIGILYISTLISLTPSFFKPSFPVGPKTLFQLSHSLVLSFSLEAANSQRIPQESKGETRFSRHLMAGISLVQRAAFSAARRLGLAAQSRSYAAVALQDYCYYDEEEEEQEQARDRPEPRAEPLGSMAGRGVQWVLIGYPGVQKHVYAGRLSKLLEVPHISMGSLVRQELNPRSSLYKQIANAVNEGKLVPEDIIFGLLSKRLEEGYHRGETGFILDGIPRTRIQAEILDQIADIDLVVNFKCNDACLLKKHLGSGICACCGKSSNMSSLESANLPLRSMELAQHTQLNSSCAIAEDACKEKLRIYEEQSKPLEEYYRKQRKLLDFHVADGPGETWQGLLAALHLQHVDALSSSSPKLSA